MFLCLTYLDKNNLDCSSLSIYVSNLENLSDISEDERQALDIFIDQLYEEMDKGTWRIYISTVFVGFKLAGKVKTLVALVSFHFLPKFLINLDFFVFVCLFSFFCTVSGQFLNCEGSGLYALQSSCKFNRVYKVTTELWRFESFCQGHFKGRKFCNNLQSG